MKKKAINIIKYSLSAVLAAVLVWFAFRGVDWKAFLDGLRQTRWIFVALYVVAAILALVFRTERWILLMHPLDPTLKRLFVWDSLNIGNLINVVLPGAGEFVRGGYVSSKRMSYEKTLGTIICERLSDTIAIIVLLAVALICKWESFGPFFHENIWLPLVAGTGGTIGWILALAGVMLVVFVWAVFRFRTRVKMFGRIADALRGLGTGFASISHVRHKWLFVLHTVLIWGMYTLMMWFTFLALPMLDSLDMADALFLSSVGNLASVIPVPGGIGAYHYLVALTVQSLYGATWDIGILLATLGHEAHAILIIILGVICYLRLSLRKKQE